MKNKKSFKFAGMILSFVLFVIGTITLFMVSEAKAYSNTVASTSYLSYNTEEMVYLSDVKYLDESYVKSGYYVRLDKNNDSKLISVNIDGERTTFIKGISAWATSNLVYDVSDLDYDYFTAYLGVDATRTETYYNGGVSFKIYTSQDGKEWTEAFKTGTLKGWDDAVFAKVNIRDVNYLRLYAYENGNSWYSHWYDDAVYANAKLIKESYQEKTTKDDLVQPVSYYDNLIRECESKGETCEQTLLKRTFVNNVGYDVLQAYLAYSNEYHDTISWLMNDQKILEEYLLGGTPDGSYGTSINILNELYEKYKADLADPKYGDLYLKMMISLSLTHSANVGLWVTGAPEDVNDTNGSNAINRYAIYKKLHEDGLLRNEIFEHISVEEMRFVMNNIIDDEEILWLNEFATLNNSTDPYKFLTYRFGYDYNKDQYYDLAQRDKWNNTVRKELSPNPYHFLNTYTDANGKTYQIQYGIKNRPKLWIVFEEGGVCGAISKTGSNIIGTYGVPSSVVSQPGHAAYIYMNLDSKGNKIWTLYNDVSGWGQTGKTEKLSVRMPNGWGTGSYVGDFPGSYVLLAQAALNDYSNYVASEKIIMKAGAYKDNSTKLKQIYEDALKVQNINFDAWLGLVNTYLDDSNSTSTDFLNLAKRITTDLRYYPLPMHDLMRLIEKRLSGADHAIYLNLLNNALTLASKATDQDVLQARPTQQVANYLLQKNDTEIASFSFDGENAGQIVLDERYEGNGVVWEYSLDGGQNWQRVNEMKKQLSNRELSVINVETDILVRIVGAMEAIYDIDITKSNVAPTVYNNDLENKVIGATDTMEWKLDGEENWTSFKKEAPDLTGNKTVEVRIGYTGTKLASESVTLKYTEDTVDETQRYVSVSRLTVEDFSTDEPGHQNEVAHAIDGNLNTIWHTKWDGSDKDKYITIKVDKPITLTKLQYVPRQDANNGKITKAVVLTSMDGETWKEVATDVVWDMTKNAKEIVFEEGIEAQYIKLVGKETSGSYASAAMINLYEDATKIKEEPIPTPSETPEPTPSETPEPTPSETPEPTPSETPTPTPSETPEPTPSETPAPSPSETVKPTTTPKPSTTNPSTSKPSTSTKPSTEEKPTTSNKEEANEEKDSEVEENKEENKEEEKEETTSNETSNTSNNNQNSIFDSEIMKYVVIGILAIVALVIIIL